MSTSARKKAERIKRMKEDARIRQYMRERQAAKERLAEREFGEYKFPDPVGYRESSHARCSSVDTGAGVAAAVTKKEYTGTLVKGIATMHKSNAVPIISKEEAIEVATMRRN